MYFFSYLTPNALNMSLAFCGYSRKKPYRMIHGLAQFYDVLIFYPDNVN